LGVNRVDHHAASGGSEADGKIRSHIIIIAIVIAFSTHFFYANRKQSKGKKVIECTVSIVHGEHKTEFDGLIAATGRVSIYILRV